MKSLIALCLSALAFSALALPVSDIDIAGQAPAPVFINFDTDTSGRPINAPDNFDSARLLSDTYAAWGVGFSGTGYILNDSMFTAYAPTPPNFLASSDGGFEQLTLTQGYKSVSLLVTSFGRAASFKLNAYNQAGLLLGSSILNLGSGWPAFSAMSWTSTSNNIRGVIVIETFGDATFAIDNLRLALAAPVPEPSTALLLIIGLCAASFQSIRRSTTDR